MKFCHVAGRVLSISFGMLSGPGVFPLVRRLRHPSKTFLLNCGPSCAFGGHFFLSKMIPWCVCQGY